MLFLVLFAKVRFFPQMTKHFRTFSFVHHIFAEMSGRFGKIIQQRSENTAETANDTEARSKCIESP